MEKLIFFLVILVTKTVKIKIDDFFSFKVYQCLYPRKSVLKLNRENLKFATFYFPENNISSWKKKLRIKFQSCAAANIVFTGHNYEFKDSKTTNGLFGWPRHIFSFYFLA